MQRSPETCLASLLANCESLAWNKEESMNIVGVCACPAGIAHTYMAAESLENAARKRGHSIKVETDGSGGVENRLTAQEIAAADVVVVAADIRVEMDRFRGKPLVKVPVSDAIRNVSGVLDRVEAGDVPAYEG